MSSLKTLRTKETYREKIKTRKEGTQINIIKSIENFETFCMEKHGKVNLIPEMKELESDDLFDVLQTWINWNDKRAASTMRIHFSNVKKYLHYMGIRLYREDIANELEFKRLSSEDLYGLSLTDIQTIFKILNYKYRTLFTCQLSALMRVGEMVQLRKKHLILDHENIIVKIPSTIAKFNKGRTTYFSKEASKMISVIIKNLAPEDLIFTKNTNVHHAELAVEQVLRRAIIKAGLDMRYESNNRYMINTHGFRAYGITKVSRHDPNFAKKLAGQKGYMLQYDRLDDVEKLKIYEKFEIDLLIDHNTIQKATIAKLQTVNYNGISIDDVKEIIRQELKQNNSS